MEKMRRCVIKVNTLVLLKKNTAYHFLVIMYLFSISCYSPYATDILPKKQLSNINIEENPLSKTLWKKMFRSKLFCFCLHQINKYNGKYSFLSYRVFFPQEGFSLVTDCLGEAFAQSLLCLVDLNLSVVLIL